jgi:hypothetical protein
MRASLTYWLRLLALRPVRASQLPGEFGVALLAGLSLLLWLALDRLRAPPQGQFDGLGIPALALVMLLILAMAWVLARASRPALRLRAALWVLLAPLPLLAGAWIDADASGRVATFTWLLLGLYALLYAWQALRRLTGAAQPRSLLGAIALLALYGWFGQVVDAYPSLWTSPDADEDEQALPAAAAEALLFEQRARLDHALEGVVAGHGADPAVFFVGFAGVAEQRVFAEEIKLASMVVAQRYDSGSRQLLLLNDQRDVDSYPLASVSGLRYALKGVAGKMNLQRDILFLSLSSHGSDEPTLAVSNGGLPLEQLTGENLQTALRDSGVKWRIIVISACYAGAFIEPLRTSATVLITAAAADRTSFGCANDRDLTYFGEAFYRDALPRARSLEEAFATAKAAIAQREAAEQVAPSVPQAFFGADIMRLLAQRPMAAPLQQAGPDDLPRAR